MFEGCLVESRGLAISRTQRWSTLGSLTFQCALAAVLIAVPLLRPQALPMLASAPHLALSMPTKPPVVVAASKASSAASSAFAAPQASQAPATSAHPFIFVRSSGPSNEPEPSFDPNLRMTSTGFGPNGIATIIGPVGNGPNVTVVHQRPIGPVQVSSGVSEGLLLEPIRPVYPALARQARVQGSVVMEAVISTAGRIESLRAVSGPPMLRPAALSAVQAARYLPYKLNGQPIEVQTTITVVFQLGS
jgi:protein TonB